MKLKLILSSTALGVGVSVLGFVFPSDPFDVILAIIVCEAIEGIIAIYVYPRIQQWIERHKSPCKTTQQDLEDD